MARKKFRTKKQEHSTGPGWAFALVLAVIVLAGLGYLSVNKPNMKLETLKSTKTESSEPTKKTTERDVDLEDLDIIAGSVDGESDFDATTLDELSEE